MTSLYDIPVGSWTTERTLGLAARCRGSLLTGWADNADCRAGAGTADALRDGLAFHGLLLPREPAKDVWYPVAAQLLVTERILADHFTGDRAALVVALTEDAARQTSKAAHLALRLGGLSTMLRLAPHVHPEAYDEGQLKVKVGRRSAEFAYSGAELFGHPTWAFLQGAALVVLGATIGKQVSVAADLAPDSAVLRAEWQ